MDGSRESRSDMIRYSIDLHIMEALQDPSRLLPPTPGFHCSEKCIERNDDDSKDDDLVGRVEFRTNTPDQELIFSCRDPSVGVLASSEQKVEIKATESVDPHFFDTDYTLAGRTGFQIWAATRLLVEYLCWKEPLPPGSRALELGSGIGVVGSALAATGSQVLLTDLPTLVENATQPNLRSNRRQDYEGVRPDWMEDAIPIGKGWAATRAVDWTISLSKQISADHTFDYVVASDCVWLRSMLDSLLDTVASLFEICDPTFIMSFQRRESVNSASAMFTTVDSVVSSIRNRGWKLKCIAWRPIEESKEVFIFEIRRG